MEGNSLPGVFYGRRYRNMRKRSGVRFLSTGAGKMDFILETFLQKICVIYFQIKLDVVYLLRVAVQGRDVIEHLERKK